MQNLWTKAYLSDISRYFGNLWIDWLDRILEVCVTVESVDRDFFKKWRCIYFQQTVQFLDSDRKLLQMTEDVDYDVEGTVPLAGIKSLLVP